MTEHLGQGKHGQPAAGSGNVRNGTRPKTVLTESTGEVGIDVLRDRAGTSGPQIVKKRQRRLTGVDEMVLSLYAKGLTTGEISAHFAEIYGASVSRPGEPGSLGPGRRSPRPRQAQLSWPGHGIRSSRPADVCGASPRRLAIRGPRLPGGGEDRVVPGSVRWPGGLIVRPQPAVCHEPGGQRDVFCFGLLGRFADGACHCAIPRSAGKSRVLYLSRWLVRRWRFVRRARSGGGSRRAAGVRRRRIRRRSGPSRCSSPSKGAAVRSCGRVGPG